MIFDPVITICFCSVCWYSCPLRIKRHFIWFDLRLRKSISTFFGGVFIFSEPVSWLVTVDLTLFALRRTWASRVLFLKGCNLPERSIVTESQSISHLRIETHLRLNVDISCKYETFALRRTLYSKVLFLKGYSLPSCFAGAVSHSIPHLRIETHFRSEWLLVFSVQ